ncbi:DUF5693 family protein [Desulfotomaculum copahuensis]|uniref:Uncharacterized protein n=1 Tax=Desulfotomaculum copahuensis TaxID=1838280 RepID=A0A1B7LBF9_9FIRM|nr:DUF5693 family protein [Desulfotomaculum copahuensis]OAT79823.1 hypothetical protein A6M21_15400 [Desulfotomaculum copahuensis]
MNHRWYSALLIILLIAGMAAAGYAGYQRYRAEVASRSVEMAMSYDDVSALARQAGKSPLDILRLLREQGLTTVLYKEPTVDDLRAAGEFSVMTGQELLVESRLGNQQSAWINNLQAAGGLVPGDTYLVTTSKDTDQRLIWQLRAKTRDVQSYNPGAGVYIVRSGLDYQSLKDIGLGFPGAQLQDSVKAGLFAIVQVRSWPEVTSNSLEQVFKPLKQIPNLSALAFNDEVIPGYPLKIRALAREVNSLGVPVCQIEFSKQKGVDQLGMLLGKRVVRLHSIFPKDMGRYNFASAEARYVLAATERNMRVLLVRPFILPDSGNVLQDNLHYVATIKQELARKDLTTGRASIFPSLPVSRPLLFIMGLGVIAGGLLLLRRLGLRRYEPVIGLLAALAWAGLLFAALDPARKLMALAAVIIFPTLAVITNVRAKGAPPWESIGMLLRTTLISLPGALFTVGLLADTGYMLLLDQFSGVKLAYLGPLVLVAASFYLFSGPDEPVGRRIRRTLDQPVQVKWALLTLILLAVMAVYVVRTGNDTSGIVPVSSLELKFRGILETVLSVRPRTKEFLLGHPLLMLLFYKGYRDNRYLPLLVFGTIGQISLVNTFDHIHTPIMISLFRLVNGLWTGILAGLVLILLVNLAERLWNKYFDSGKATAQTE